MICQIESIFGLKPLMAPHFSPIKSQIFTVAYMGLPNLAPPPPPRRPAFILNLIPDLLPSPLHSPRPPYSSRTHHTCFCFGVSALTAPLRGNLSLQICMWLPTHFLQFFCSNFTSSEQPSLTSLHKTAAPRGLSTLTFLFHSPHHDVSCFCLQSVSQSRMSTPGEQEFYFL